MKLLIVEDHPKLRENIMKYFSLKGYVSEGAVHGEEALEKIRSTAYDTIILDINLPLLNGKEFLTIIRDKKNYTPVIALTSNSALEDKLEAFSLGVDDYMTKPFELAELEARVIALNRRKGKTIEQIIKHKLVEVDIGRHKVFLKGKEIDMGNKEYMIIEFLLKNKGYPKNKSELLEFVWGEKENSLNFNSSTLEAHISYIRRKLGKDFIKTIKGVGYVIE